MPAYLLTPLNMYLDTLIYDYPLERKSICAGDNMPDKPLESVYIMSFHAAKLIEPKIDSSEPSRWTSVYSDNKLMRKLLKVHFLTDYYSSPIFQKAIFLKDLLADRRQFCSSLLVNTVLALACVSP